MEIDAQLESRCPLSQVERVDGLWFEDGNIAVVAQNKGFRVHNAVLSQHSAVFKDMFATDSLVRSSELLQDANDARDEIDGVPAVYLQGDSATDITYFLKLLYDWTFFYKKGQTTFPVVSSLLRISTKYMAGPIRKAMITKIRSIYSKPTYGFTQRVFGEIANFNQQEFVYFKLALELNVNSVLPELYYAICKHPPQKIKEQLGDMDKSILWTLRLGRRKVNAIEAKELRPKLLGPAIVDHTKGKQCRTFVHLFVKRNKSYLPFVGEVPGFIGWDTCGECFGKLCNMFTQFNTYIHPRLPDMFGLDNWDVLERLDEESTVFEFVILLCHMHVQRFRVVSKP